jgi:ubiquinone/menaquinone biosynthesis C-methylase UbiE
MDYKKIYDECHQNGYTEEGDAGAYAHLIDHLNKAKISYNTILDVGCSIGNGVKMFNEMGKDTTGLDVSEVAVNIAKKRNLKTICGSATKIPFENNSFDLLSSTDVLEHLLPEDIDKSINELIRVSKKYIALKLSTMAETSDIWVKFLKTKGINIPNLHLSILENEKWKELFNKKEIKLIYEYQENSAKFIILIYEKVV